MGARDADRELAARLTAGVPEALTDAYHQHS
jgi:hypothetical protein